MRLFDVGANLTDEVFRGVYRGRQLHPEDYGAVLDRALRLGTDRIMVTAGTLAEAGAACALARAHGGRGVQLSTTVGVHPTRCLELERDPGLLPRLIAAAREPEVAAVGEFGLDYDRLHFCPADVQMRWFERQFALVDAAQKPLFLHMRAAGEDFCRVVRENRHRFAEGVVHSFTGTAAEAQMLLALGLHIGLNGCSLRTAEALEVVRTIPLDRLMVGSDAPWCGVRRSHASYAHVQTHVPAVAKERYQAACMVDGRNEPWATRQVVEVLAALHGLEAEALAERIYATTCRVFAPGS